MIQAKKVVLALLAGTVSGGAQTREPPPDTPWWRESVCYEIFVRSFQDSDGDGIGDFRGLTARLPYLSDLGVGCLWLMPIAQSPSYHGYDVTNYYEVNRDYGSKDDFRQLMAEAHRRGIRVVVDLVLNHMSSEHPYFRSALLNRESAFRDWFLWSATERKTIGWSVATWHKAEDRNEYYYGLFWRGMPDLNLAHPAVAAEAKRIARFWLEEMDVDGFRLDAVGLFFEDGDNPRNGPGTHPWLRDLAGYIRQVKSTSFTVGEVWDSVEAMRAYYPDQLDTYFAFPLADAVIDAARKGSGRSLLFQLDQIQRAFPRGRYGSFLRNHDQTRTMTELNGDWRRARLAATLLLTLPGVPFVYYGEEIGMTGSKPDPRLRTPMHWSRQPSMGFTTGLPWEPLQPDSLTANVEAQSADGGSLLNHYRTLIRLRSSLSALGSTGAFIALETGSDQVLAYLRRDGNTTAVVVANLGDHAIDGSKISSMKDLLPRGTYRVRSALGRGDSSTLRIGRDGRIHNWTPTATMEPLSAVVLELVAGSQ
jgi:glycosidase